MVELLGVKFAQKDLSQNFRGTYGAATDFKLKNDIIQQIWLYTTTIFEISTYSKNFREN